jgi:hypothetical protein
MSAGGVALPVGLLKKVPKSLDLIDSSLPWITVGIANALVGALVFFSCRNCQCIGRFIAVFLL